MPKLIAFTLLVLALVLLWRKWATRQRAGYIETYPYQRFLDKRLAARRPELSA